MVKLGFSLYPEHYSLEQLLAYVDQFESHDCERVFLSLLQLNLEDDEIFETYKRVVAYCRQKGYKVFADLNPCLIEKLGWMDNLIQKAYEFGFSGIRLDESFDDDQLVALTCNQQGIKLELNMSTEPELLKRLVEKGANLSNITACHNFYPHRFTGLSTDYFTEISQKYSQYGIERAAFITAQSADTGPWPVSEGLCTIEDQRGLPLHAQYKWLVATGLVDHVIIANQMVSTNELATLHQGEAIVFDVLVSDNISEVEERIVKESHQYRGDVSDYVVRSTGHRSCYSECEIHSRQSGKTVSRGDILIDNLNYSRYCGELQLALKEFTVSHKTNFVGRICSYDLPLLDLLKPWQEFELRIVSRGVDDGD